MTIKTKNLILGAGPAGMACAYELSRSNEQALVIEKSDCVGGLAKTLRFVEGDDVFLTDIGPHRFFSKNKELYSMIEGLLGDDWIKVSRQTRQLIEGKFYEYPIKAKQALGNVGVFRASAMMFSYALGHMRYAWFNKPIRNFEDYAVAKFGRQLAQFNILNYTEKIWGIPCSQIHPDWAFQRIKGLNLFSAVLNALRPSKKETPKSLVDAFYYPKYGTGTIYEAMKQRISSVGSEVKTQSYPTKIMHDDSLITQIEFSQEGVLKDVQAQNVVSSIPITQLLSLLSPQPPQEVLDAASQLRWRNQVYVFLTLNKEKVTDDNWIYVPNKSIPFARIAEMKNFSLAMAPKDKTSLFVEYFVSPDDELWSASKDGLIRKTIHKLAELDLIKPSEVRKGYAFKKTHVYPVYDLTYPQHIKTVMDYLKRFTNLQLIGRPGRFQYTNQDHSLELGLRAAKNIAKNEAFDLDNVGKEDEYFETGKLDS